jgi:glycosyltransferase involved in cell wall biosynthesis
MPVKKIAFVSPGPGVDAPSVCTAGLARGLTAAGLGVEILSGDGASGRGPVAETAAANHHGEHGDHRERRKGASGWRTLPALSVFSAVRSAVAAVARLPSPEGPLFGGFAVRRAARAAAEFGAEIVHAQTPGVFRAGDAVARRLGVPLAVTVHEFVEGPGELPWPEGRAPACIVPSEALRENLVNSGRVPKRLVHVVPPGVPLEGGEQGRSRRGARNAEVGPDPRSAFGPPGSALRASLVVGTLSPLVAGSGTDRFIEAARLVADGGVDAEFVVAGEGPLERELKALSARLGVRRRLTFAGGDALPEDVLPNLDIYVSAGARDGSGALALLAMAHALPVVAAGAGGLYPVVRDGVTGLLVRPDDALALARGVLALAREPGLRADWGRAGLEVVARHFSPAAAAEAVAGVYEELASRHGADHPARRRRSRRV